MKTYTTNTVIWRKGLEVPAGTELVMSDAEAKYIKHALTEKKAPAASKPIAKPEAQPELAPEDPAPVAEVEAEPVAPLAVSVVEDEAPHERPHRRRK